MTNTTIATANVVKQWDSKYFISYVRKSRYIKYMGTNANSIIQIKSDLTKKKGDTITIPLVGAIDPTAGPNDGSTTLVGNEKALPNDGHPIVVSVIRDAVVINTEEIQKSPIAIRNAAKRALMDLSKRYLRDDITTALHSIDGVAFEDSTQGQRDTWVTNNADRVLFGDAVGNLVGGDHSASLLVVDATMKLSKDMVSLAKRRAMTAETANSDGIRPVTYGEDEETFVMFVDSNQFRDLRKDMENDLQQARERAGDNPLFRSKMDLYWDNVVIREMPEYTVNGAAGHPSMGQALTGTGAGGIDLAPAILCGAQAVGVAWAMRTKTTTRKEDDYGFQKGVGFHEMRGIDKLQYGNVDWATFTVYTASVADA